MFGSVVKRDKEVLKLIASIANLIRSASSANYELICSVVAHVCKAFKRLSVYTLTLTHTHILTRSHTHTGTHSHMSLVRLFVYIDSHSKHFERSPCAQLAN